jgi:hypothetical protein
MSQAQSSVLAVGESVNQLVQKLINKSYADYIDVDKSLDWAQGVVRTKLPKRPECCWLYGTPEWEKLTSEQRFELLWKQTARDVAMFIWLEQTLPPVYVGYVNQFGDKLHASVREYMMLFSKEEIVHTLMFRRYVTLADLKPFDPPEGIHQFFVEVLPKLPPVAGVLFTYLVEIVAEIGAMDGTNSPDVDPLTRQLFALHHHEEARHIAFGRLVIEEQLRVMPEEAVAKLRGIVEPFTARLLAQYTYNAELAHHVDFDLGFAPDDVEALERIRRSPNNVRMNNQRFGTMVSWLKKLSLLTPEFQI